MVDDKDKYVKKTDNPILVVTMGRGHKVEIGPRVSDPGYPVHINFVYWDIQRTGMGAGADAPMCAIKLTRKWYDKYIKAKAIHEWLNTYDKLLAYFEKESGYEFGCPVCGLTLKTLDDYRSHLEEHKKLLANF